MVKLAHISDLHFGDESLDAVDALRASLAACRPDLVVVTGDLTQSGRKREFAAASEFLKSLSAPFICTPGNHDTPVFNPAARFSATWRRFEREFGEAALQTASLGRMTIIAVNTARAAAPSLNWSYGRFSRKDIAQVVHHANVARRSGSAAIVACHHPFEKGPGRAGQKSVGRGQEALERFAEAGVAAVLTGHVHVSHARPLAAVQGKILTVAAGTAMSRRQRNEDPSFNVIEQIGLTELAIGTLHLSDSEFTVTRSQRFSRQDGAWIAA